MIEIDLNQRPLKLVLDTHVVLEMLLWHSPRHVPLLDAQKTGACIFLVELATLDEFERVLRYPTLKLEADQQREVYASYLACASLQHPGNAPADLPRCKDVNDQKFLELAFAGDANALLTRDKKLLKVGKHKRLKQKFLTMAPERFGALFDASNLSIS